MILFVGQVEREIRDRDAFQEMDYRAFFGSMAKWAAEIDEPERMAEMVSRAFHTALAGRPGPVVRPCPRTCCRAPSTSRMRPFETVETSPGAEMAALEAVGRGPRPDPDAGRRALASDTARVARFAGKVRAAGRDLFPPRASVRSAASLLRRRSGHRRQSQAGGAGEGHRPGLIGGRAAEMTSQGYTLFDIPDPRMKLVHAIRGRRNWAASIIRISPFMPRRRLLPLRSRLKPRRDRTGRGRRARTIWTGRKSRRPSPARSMSGDHGMAARGPGGGCHHLQWRGQLCGWIHRFYRFRRFGQHVAPISGSMGYGVPAAVAMKRLHPGRTGGRDQRRRRFPDERPGIRDCRAIRAADHRRGRWTTAIYGTIRMHQEREYPGRVSATDLVNPDFAAYARAFGGFGVAVERTADFPAAFDAARARGTPSIIHLEIDPDAITPSATLTAIRPGAGGEGQVIVRRREGARDDSPNRSSSFAIVQARFPFRGAPCLTAAQRTLPAAWRHGATLDVGSAHS